MQHMCVRLHAACGSTPLLRQEPSRRGLLTHARHHPVLNPLGLSRVTPSLCRSFEAKG